MGERTSEPERRTKGTGSMFFRERSGAWFCRWKRPGQSPIERKTGTKHRATRVLAKVEELAEAGADLESAVRSALGLPDPKQEERELTFGEVVTRYLDALERDGKRTPENMERERSRANSVQSATLAGLAPSDIHKPEAGRWTEYLRRERRQGGSGVNRSLSFASCAWRWGQEFGYVQEDRSSPFGEIRRSRETPRDKGDTVTPTEARNIAAKCRPDFARLILGHLNTGARPKELQRLEWRDVRLDTSPPFLAIRVPNEKARRGRKIPITDELRALLNVIRSERKPTPRARVFTRVDGQPWTRDARRYHWRVALAKCTDDDLPAHKREELWFYDFRAAAITTMLGAGIPPLRVARIVGHKHVTTTMIYAGDLSEEQAAALPAMNTALRTGIATQ